MHEIEGCFGRGVRGGVGKYGETFGRSGFSFLGDGDFDGDVGGVERVKIGSILKVGRGRKGWRIGLGGADESGESLEGNSMSISACLIGDISRSSPDPVSWSS